MDGGELMVAQAHSGQQQVILTSRAPAHYETAQISPTLVVAGAHMVIQSPHAAT